MLERIKTACSVPFKDGRWKSLLVLIGTNLVLGMILQPFLFHGFLEVLFFATVFSIVNLYFLVARKHLD